MKNSSTRRPTSLHISVRLRRRGNACLIVTGVLLTFTVLFLLGAGLGHWTPWHTRLVSSTGSAACAALACYCAAAIRVPKQTVLARLERVCDDPLEEVTHPGVSHLRPAPVLTAIEQAK